MTNNAINSSIPIEVTKGGTQASSFVAYAPIVGGTTSTGALQSVASAGNEGEFLISGGSSALPTWAVVNPVFNYYLGTQATNVTGTGNTYILGTGGTMVKLIDVGNNVSTSGVFTVPYTGNYLIGYNITFANILDSGGVTGLYIEIYSSTSLFRPFNESKPQQSAPGGQCTFSSQAIIPLIQGETVDFRITASGQTANSVDVQPYGGNLLQTYIYGQLVR